MGASDKMEAGMDKAKGKAKEAYGKVANDDEKIVEGKLDQAKGSMKQATEEAKDNVKDAFDK